MERKSVTTVLRFEQLEFRVHGFPDDVYFGNAQDQIRNNAFLIKILRELVAPAATIIDVGANVGITAALAAKIIPTSQVIAIEPSPVNFAHLCTTIRESGLDNVIPINLCIADANGTVNFSDSAGLAGCHVTSDGEVYTTGVRAIPSKTVDTLVSELSLSRVDLVKIDVEGFELDVLRGMTDTINKHSPLILMEFNSFTLAQLRNISPRLLLDFIQERFGYCYAMRDADRIVAIRSKEDFYWLLYANMTKYNSVDDLLFSNKPIHFVEK